ncbi:MAG: glycerophosphodiester phosphodiesterase family protein [Microbacterium sp.]|uniref:glycerophosphodiester phosphodiesterase family protein n=1 Tax=Microbacterium sp. TaxID=51671 RepID=UPI0039E6AACF
MPSLVIGHRGAPGHRPEHGRSSYELAIAMGADAVEPDVVPTRDGVLVVRHENEISATTDVAERPDLAHHRRTKSILGTVQTGWFTEDLTWAELSSLRSRERIPGLRPRSATFDGHAPVLRLCDLLALLDAAQRPVRLVLEIKHAAYFQALGLDMAAMVETTLRTAGWADRDVIVESFEPTVLARLRARGLTATYVQLVEAEGSPVDLVLAHGADAPSYADLVAPAGLDALAAAVDGISVDKAIVLDAARARVVADAHARGLQVYVWTARPENVFLDPRFRRGSDPAAFGDYEAEWAALRAAAVDGIFADYPDLAAPVFR